MDGDEGTLHNADHADMLAVCRCFTHAEAGFETLCDISLTSTVTSLHFGGQSRYLLLINCSDDRSAMLNTDPAAPHTFQVGGTKAYMQVDQINNDSHSKALS